MGEWSPRSPTHGCSIHPFTVVSIHRLTGSPPYPLTAPLIYRRSPMPPAAPASRPDAGLLVLRLGLGALLLFHGIYKVTHGVAWIAGPLGKAGLPAWLQYGTYVGDWACCCGNT